MRCEHSENIDRQEVRGHSRTDLDFRPQKTWKTHWLKQFPTSAHTKSLPSTHFNDFLLHSPHAFPLSPFLWSAGLVLWRTQGQVVGTYQGDTDTGSDWLCPHTVRCSHTGCSGIHSPPVHNAHLWNLHKWTTHVLQTEIKGHSSQESTNVQRRLQPPGAQALLQRQRDSAMIKKEKIAPAASKV